MRYSNLDSDSSLFFARDLEHIRSKIYEKRYPDLLARVLCPPSPDPAPDGADSIIVQEEDRRGAAKILAPGSKGRDLPMVEVLGSETLQKVRDCGVGFEYTVGEVRKAALAGKSLTDKKAAAARKASEELLDNIIAFGDSDHGLKGFVNHASVSAANAGNGTWSAATDAEILEDLNEPAETIGDVTKGIYGRGLTMLLPVAKYNLLAQRRLSEQNTTLLKFFLENNPFIKEVIPWYKLKGQGAGSTDRMVIYPRDPEVLNYEVPAEFEILDPQPVGLSFIVPCRLVTAGVIMHQPKAMLYRDNI